MWLMNRPKDLKRADESALLVLGVVAVKTQLVNIVTFCPNILKSSKYLGENEF